MSSIFILRVLCKATECLAAMVPSHVAKLPESSHPSLLT
jgi:hypothetical protein